MLGGFEHVVLVGARDPVAFFGYPDGASRLAPDGTSVVTLATLEEDDEELEEDSSAALQKL